MAKDRKTANLFEVLKSASLEREKVSSEKPAEAAPPSPGPDSPVRDSAPVAVEYAPPPRPAPPVVTPPVSSQEDPRPRYDAVRPSAIPERPQAPALSIGERIIQMTTTTAMFLALIVLAVLCIIFVLGREYERARKGGGAPERAGSAVDAGRRPESGGGSQRSRTYHTIELLKGPIRTDRERDAANEMEVALRNVLREKSFNPARVRRESKGGMFYIYYNEYADRRQAEDDVQNLRRISVRNTALDPRIQSYQKE